MPSRLAASKAAIDVLRKLGAEVRTIRVSPLSLWTDCNRTIHQAEAYAIHEKDVQERPQDFAAMLTRNRIVRRVHLGGEVHQGAAAPRGALQGDGGCDYATSTR